jgi:hypothetical protein
MLLPPLPPLPLPVAPSGRAAGGKFAKGNPGKQRGCKHHASRLVESLVELNADAIAQAAIKCALAGDAGLLVNLLARLAPMPRGRRITVTLPPITSVQDALRGLAQLAADVSAAKISPEEAGSVAELLRSFIAAADVVDLAKRLEALETAQAARDAERGRGGRIRR